MNRERVKELLPVFQAFADGEEIEYFSRTYAKWRPMTCPNWYWDDKYRIKRKPREWLICWNDSDVRADNPRCYELDNFKDCVNHWKYHIKVREVLDE